MEEKLKELEEKQAEIQISLDQCRYNLNNLLLAEQQHIGAIATLKELIEKEGDDG